MSECAFSSVASREWLVAGGRKAEEKSRKEEVSMA